MLLIGCAGIRVRVATDCSWAEPIEVDDATADWLEGLGYSEAKVTLLERADWETWPEHITSAVVSILETDNFSPGFEDFIKDVGDHTELYYRWCE